MALLKEAPLIQTVDVPVYPLEKSKVSKMKGVVIGMFLFGVVSIIVLIIRRLYKSVLEN
ncbi:hypothetical protein ACFX5U_21020 [Sphingobacterium sp. SG20118]|uniref:hypothetical protein n=1 Tax=Sphingobacterium sp. SG20118 TaxID=3367156 RepID=UPI0037DFC68C